jgi:hypothetical protein
LREEQRHQRRAAQDIERRLENRLQLAFELRAHEKRRDTDANRPEVHVAEAERLAHFERPAFPAEDFAQLTEIVARDEIVQARRFR